MLCQALPLPLIGDRLQLGRVADTELEVGVSLSRVGEGVLQRSGVPKLHVHLVVHAQALPQLLAQEGLLLALPRVLQVGQLLLPERAQLSVTWGSQAPSVVWQPLHPVHSSLNVGPWWAPFAGEQPCTGARTPKEA